MFSFLVRMLVTGELFDTQVGFKAFRGDVAAALFPLLTDDGFAGDVELLYIALKYNLAIRRIPVRLLRTGSAAVIEPLVAHLDALSDALGDDHDLAVLVQRRSGPMFLALRMPDPSDG